jgi:hypothetical protein
MNDKYFDYIEEVTYYWQENVPHIRQGQAMFNVLHKRYPKLAEEIRGTDLDPFHKNFDNLNDFRQWAYENIGK